MNIKRILAIQQEKDIQLKISDIFEKISLWRKDMKGSKHSEKAGLKWTFRKPKLWHLIPSFLVK